MNRFALMLLVIGLFTNAGNGKLPASCKAPRVQITVDPRIELLAVVQTLGRRQHELGRVTRYPSVYKDDVLAYFARYKDHPAVTIRLKHRTEGEAPARALLNMEKARGFMYIEPVCRALETYEKHHEAYADFIAFYPEIITMPERPDALAPASRYD